VGVWLNRLSLISGITTFFAGIDSQLLSYVYPFGSTAVQLDTAHKIAVTTLAGAVVCHWMAAIIAYIGCFALYRYELVDAAIEEESASQENDKDMPRARGPPQPLIRPRSNAIPAAPPTLKFPGIHLDVTLMRIHPFGLRLSKRSLLQLESGHTLGIPDLPVDLVAVHTACVMMAMVGFVLAMIGIMTYLWAGVPQYVSIFSTVMLGFCLMTGAYVLR